MTIIFFLTSLFAEHEIEGRWHLVGYEEAVMYQFENNYRYSIYSIDGNWGDLEDAGGSPNPYTVEADVITINLFFGTIVSYQMNYRCNGQVVDFIDGEFTHSTLFREGYNYIDNECEESGPFDGLTLITNMGGGGEQIKYSHLIDNNQNIINSWMHDTSPASIAYLTPDSILYVPCKTNQNGGGQGAGPTGGRFKKMDWSGNIIWDYYLPNDICIPHHDIEVLPNGNFLVICSETKTEEEAENAGKQNLNGPMTMDMIIEIEPIDNNEANIIWEWHFWDHLIQDINPFNNNYGIINENPQLLDINCQSSGGGGNNGPGISDWNHSNCISYNPNFDQIVISSRHMNEFYVIDHSTTTEEAASHTGGTYQVGGDFLYRWGNSQNYNMGNTQILYSQHSVNWIPNGYPGSGKFILFNNNHSNGNSAVLEIDPPIDENGFYHLNDNGFYGPVSFDWIYQPSTLYSNTQSGAFRLPNGNTIITSSSQNDIFEINMLGDIEWSYSGNLSTARAIKYPLDYLGANELIGDLNNDQILDILDIVQLVNLVLENTYEPTGDLNSDQTIDVLDIVQLVNIILS